MFSLFVNTVLRAPPPCLVHERPVRWIHQSNDPVIDRGRHSRAEVCGLEFFAKRRHPWSCGNLFVASSESRAGWPGIRNEYPNKTVPLFAGQTTCINAVHF